MRYRPLIVFDCGASRVSAVVFAATAEGVPTIERVFVEPLEYDTADDLQWIKAIGAAIRRIRTRQPIRGRVVLVAPGHLTLTKYIKVPHVDEAKRQRIVQFEARQNIPYPLDEVVWDYQVVHDDGIDFEIALCAIKQNIVGALVAECRQIGFEPEAIEPSCMAQVNAFGHTYPEARQSTLLINIGARSTNLVFLRGDRYFIRNITLAGSTVAQSMAEELGRSSGEMERAKLDWCLRGFSAGVGDDVVSAFENARGGFVSRLTLEITRSIANYRRQSNVEPPGRVLLTGAGSALPGLADMLGNKLKLPVEGYEALRGVPFGPGVIEGEIKTRAHLIGEAVGAALAANDRGVATINLLPGRILKARAFRKREPYLIGAAALLAIGVSLPLLVSWVTVGAFSEKLHSLEAQAEPLSNFQEEIRRTLEEIDEVRHKIAGIEGLVETRSNWITLFSDLQTRLVKVEDVWLERLEVLRPQDGQVRQSALAGSLFSGLAARRADADPEQQRTLRLKLSGRLLDRNNPLSKVSTESLNRVKALLDSFVGSEFILELEEDGTRFDTSQLGVLKFEFILVVNPQQPL